MTAIKIKDPATGTWLALSTQGPVGPPGPAGADGADGPEGPIGPQGIATTIVGEFVTRTESELPVDGAFPADWDGAGTFPGGYQMLVNEALINNNTASATFGNLWQFVGAAVAAGWIDVGQVVGPPGPEGPEGPAGPMSDEVHVGPDTPPAPEVALWFDTDDDRILGPTDMPPGGDPGFMLIKSTAADGDTDWRDPYVIPSGKVIQFPNEAAPTPKIHLYATTFGFGVESGTLTAFASSNFRIRANGMTGAEWANFAATNMRTAGSINPGTYVLITGATADNNEHYFTDCADNAAGTYFTVIEGRRLDAKSVFKIKGYQGNVTGSLPESHCKIYNSAGDDGVIENSMFNHSNATPKFHCHGDITSTGGISLLSAQSGEPATPLDPTRVSRIIDAINPVTYARTRQRAEEAGRDPAPRRYASFLAADIEACGDYVEEMTDDVWGEQDRAVSLSGLLAVAVAEIKSLRQRVAALEGT